MTKAADEALAQAAACGNLAAVDAAIAAGANPNAANGASLVWGALNGDAAVIQRLLTAAKACP